MAAVKRTILLVITLALGLSGRALAQGNRLTLAQVKKLIQIHAPDAVVAKEIGSRGIDFLPTSQTLDQLEKSGAGQAALAALRDFMPYGILEVQSAPGSQIAIDGIDRGLADAQGHLILPRIPAGTHRLSVRKVDYQASELDFILAAKEYKRVPMQLGWAGGFLTVRTDPLGAAIEIAGIGKYAYGVSDIQCRPGTYDIAATLKGMKSPTQSVVVAAGQHATVEIHLTPDPDYVRNMLADVRRHLARGNARLAVQISNDLLSIEPNNADVMNLLVTAYLRAKDFQNFQDAILKVLRTGGKVQFDLAHEHLDLSGEAIHPAVLTLTATSIAYETTAPCKYRRIETALANIGVVEVTDKNRSGMIVVRHLTPGTFLLHLELRDPAKPKSKITLYFAIPESTIESQSGVDFLASAGDSSQILNAVASAIRAGPNAQK
jgi:hypothetical protein